MREKRNWIYILTALCFALILFAYATLNNYQIGGNRSQINSEIYTNTISAVPIELRYDQEKYFISGSVSEAAVELTGSNRVSLASEMQEATRSFRVVADLTKESQGQIEVPLQITNLPSGMTAVVKPQKISIRIGKKASKHTTVQLKISADQIKDTIELDAISIADKTVTVTSDEDTIKRLDHVEAILPPGETISANYNGTFTLRPVDANGNTLAGVVSPYETSVKIYVKAKNSSSSNASSASKDESTKESK